MCEKIFLSCRVLGINQIRYECHQGFRHFGINVRFVDEEYRFNHTGQSGCSKFSMKRSRTVHNYSFNNPQRVRWLYL